MKKNESVTYEMIANKLFVRYESIYDINVQTSEYKTYYQSDSYQELELARRGDDFWQALQPGIERLLAEDDRDYVISMLQKDNLVEGVKNQEYYTLVYRIMNNGREIFHELRAVGQQTEDGLHILMGIRNIDNLIRRQEAQKDAMEAIQQKSKNRLEAVLSTAAAYMEANISKDITLESGYGHQTEQGKPILDVPSHHQISGYDETQRWIARNLIIENREKYVKVSSSSYLLSCFLHGERRVSVSFSIEKRGGSIQPCKAIFHLYREHASGDIHVFCVIYDLTEQQKQEQELERLEQQLMLSRIRNSTSQMQPHFLYNALGSIQEVILMDPQYASDLLGDFTVHLRSCVRAMTNDDPIPFTQELENIRAYVNIEKMRLGNKLEVSYEIEADAFVILPLCIQPLVENAIRHGVHKRGKAGGRVVLRTWEEPDSWMIQVDDTGVGFDTKKLFRDIRNGKRDSTGLDNIRFRLEKVMGAEVDIKSTEGTGTTVTIRLPKEG